MKKQQHLVKQVSSLLQVLIVFTLFIFGSILNPVNAQNWKEITKTVALDRWNKDYFGYSVAISGDFAIVGAYAEDEDTIGGNTLSSAGSAYIFKNIAGTWTEVQKLVASDRGARDYFGSSVAISGDVAIVGAFTEDEDTTGGNTFADAGAAYIFKNSAGTWTEVQKLVASDRGASDLFGNSVAISGSYAIVSAYTEDEDTTGGNTLIDAGSAYIFKDSAGIWLEVQKLVASDRGVGDLFGQSVAISGDYAIVGAAQEDDDTAGVNTLTSAGSAYIFKNNAGTWSEVQKIVASDRGAGDAFGFSVAISGGVAVVGAPYEDHDTLGGDSLNRAGSAYIFKNNAGTWSEVQKILASDRRAGDEFGWSVAISGDVAIIGAYKEDHDTTGGGPLSSAGSAYLFKNNAGTWKEEQKLVASDRGANDYFGYSVAISGDVAIIGAYKEDHDTIGGNRRWEAGSAYLFNKCGSSGIDIKTACDSLTWIDSVTYFSNNNTAKFTLTNAAGCDSVVILNLTMNYSSKSSDTVSVCDNYTWNVNNTTYTTTGIYKDTLTNATGCDSIVTLDLTINNTINNDTVTACERYTWNANNTNYTTSGTYMDTLTNAAGCDSTVTLDLTINYSTTSNDTVTACDRYTWNANTYTTSGIYIDTLTTTAGCDSVLTLELTIDSVSDLSTTTAGLTITANNANATYQWLNCANNYAIIAGDTTQTFTATANGNYAVELTENSCVDTSACVAIISVGLLEEKVANELFNVYPNPSNGIMNVEIHMPATGRNLDSKQQFFIYNHLAQVVREVRVKEGKNQINISQLPKGVYFIRYGNSSMKIVLID
ncbi:MAG: T9SS type A sorting domain-containing protein [Vicingaceae bacterium]